MEEINLAKEIYTEFCFFDCNKIRTGEDLKGTINLMTQSESRFRYLDFNPDNTLITDSQVIYKDILSKGKIYKVGSKDVDGQIFGYDINNIIYGSPIRYHRSGINERTNGIFLEIWEPLEYSKLTGLGKIFSLEDEDTFKDDRINIFMNDLLELIKKIYSFTQPAIGFVGELIYPDKTNKVFKNERRLPRIWWTNFYGPPYVEKYGKDFLLNAPGYRTEELRDGGVFYQVTNEFFLWDDSNQGPSVEEIEKYFKGHPLIKRIRYKPILAKNYLPKGHTPIRPEKKVISESIEHSKLSINDLSIEKIEKASQDAVEVSRNRWGINLDFTPGSIEMLEEAIDRFFERGHKPFVTTVYCLGAYLGETVRKNLGGEWKFHEDLDEVVLTNIGNKGIEFWPFNRIKKRFALGKENSLVPFYQELEKAVK